MLSFDSMMFLRQEKIICKCIVGFCIKFEVDGFGKKYQVLPTKVDKSLN
jgi:hypothetical protein